MKIIEGYVEYITGNHYLITGSQKANYAEGVLVGAAIISFVLFAILLGIVLGGFQIIAFAFLALTVLVLLFSVISLEVGRNRAFAKINEKTISMIRKN